MKWRIVLELCLLGVILFACVPAAPMPFETAHAVITPSSIRGTATATLVPTAHAINTAALTAVTTPVILTTPIPNNHGLTIEENEIIGKVEIEPLTFQPVYGSQQAVMARHAQDKQSYLPDPVEFDASGPVILWKTDQRAYRVREIGAIAARMVVKVERDGKVIFQTDAGEVSPVETLRRFWADDQHWILEIASVINHVVDNVSTAEVTGKIYLDGVLLNEQYGYQEMFGFQMLGNKPFYFYKKAERIHISYDHQDLPLIYDNVPHYGCCSGAEINPTAANNWVGFFGQHDGVWYYTEIGQYRNQSQGSPTEK